MSIQLIKNYQREYDQLRQLGATNELALKRPFSNLLQAYCQKKNLILVEEIAIKSKFGTSIRPDGIVKGLNRMDWGYWESKDESDDLSDEIQKKITKGYPDDNILFEDSQYAVLIQAGQRVAESKMQNGADTLDKLLLQFINFERPEYKQFREAIENFKKDLPPIIKALRDLMVKETQSNENFAKARNKFLKICQDSINPAINQDDIREMIVQHILTEDIFTTIFDESDFHHSNNIARELDAVINTFFRKEVKKNFLQEVRFYYEAIKNAGSRIADVREKQTFLKVIYEDFYKAYNPKGADRLGIVYTPNEIVRFMIESTDYLLFEHFGKDLLSKGVEILDPATGTGTYITDLLDYFPASKKEQIKYKYQNELHANEVSILPYYIANLNIEFAFQQKTGEYLEFENLCFVDTLDNMGFGYSGKQTNMFGVSAENTERIKRQNAKRISVIIGNPPYNAKQENYNYQNANRAYSEIDKRIKDTYIKNGTAQNQIVVYDMYTRFYRWATDRLDQNGVLAFITNRSFIESRTFDGFRKEIEDTFSYAYIIDTQSDVRANPKIAGTTHNVFGIQTGVAVMFLIRETNKKSKCRIEYFTLTDDQRKEEKLEWFKEAKFDKIPFERISPDAKHNWLNLTNNDFDSLIPICSKETKDGKNKESIFELFSLGLTTSRDEWVYDFDKKKLSNKLAFFIKVYDENLKKQNNQDFSIKWDADLSNYLKRGVKILFNENYLFSALYRPFVDKFIYFDKSLNARVREWKNVTKIDKDNLTITFTAPACSKDFHCIITDKIADHHLVGDSQCLPLYRYEKDQRIDNITDWGLEQFQSHYTNQTIAKLDIFHYVYAVLHNPAYRQKYEQNLKREFPRIPFYADFEQWALWGKDLMDLHLNYETVEPYPLQRTDITLKPNVQNKAKLRADKASGLIVLDEQTSLSGVPAEAWEYKLGNRSALEWILDQYKESKPSDPTIAEKFNTYRFADYKEQVIDLLRRVCMVSVRTMEIVNEMRNKD